MRGRQCCSLFPNSENRLLPWDTIPGLRVNTMCFLIPPEYKLSLCLVSIYSCIAAMLDSPQYRLRSIFFPPCTVPELCSSTFPITIMRIRVHPPPIIWSLYCCNMPQAYTVQCVSWIQLQEKKLTYVSLQKHYRTFQYSYSRNLPPQLL